MRVLPAIASALLVSSVVFLGSQQTGSANSQVSSTGSSQMATVPAGTRIMVRMIDPVDSEKHRANDRFRGSLEANLMAGDAVVAPRGTIVYASLLAAQSAGQTTGGELELDLTDIMIDDQMHSLATSSVEIQGEEGSRGATAKGAGAGAALGAVTGPGVITGATAGAVAGRLARAPARGEKVSVPADSLVEFTLEHPVSLPVAHK